MARTAIGPNNDTCQVWQVDGNDQWTDPVKILGRGLSGFAVLVEGTFTGTPALQARRPATNGITAGAWVAVDGPTFTANTPVAAIGQWYGSVELRLGFATLSAGSAIVTLQR